MSLLSQQPLVLRISRKNMNDGEFLRFCRENAPYRIERDANGLIVVEEPSGYEYGRRNLQLAAELYNWNQRSRLGEAADSSAGFSLPNGATRAPDASWISHSRLATTTPADREGFVHAVPEFVIEVRSRSDRMVTLRKKMQEYLANGVLLGWLLDLENEAVEIYRSGQEVEVVSGFAGVLSGEAVLPGFVFELERLK